MPEQPSAKKPKTAMAGAAGSAVVKASVIKLAGGEMITGDEAAAVMAEIMAGNATDAQIGGWLVALRAFPDDPTVVGACASTMTDFAQKISVDGASVDIVGTGGDGKDTFNCSTCCSFMVAACGLKVSKHGNRSASGNVGSADVLEGLGANIMLDADKVLSCIQGCGFGFLFAQKFHPAMRYVMPARKQLGIRTVFNALGPLTNPCRPTAQLIGVGILSMAPLYAAIFAARSVSLPICPICPPPALQRCTYSHAPIGSSARIIETIILSRERH